MGTDMKKVLKHLPSKFGELLEEELQAATSQIGQYEFIMENS